MTRRDNQADRQRRTVLAPNGARLVLPVGTSDQKVCDTLLMFAYHDMRALVSIATPFRSKVEVGRVAWGGHWGVVCG